MSFRTEISATANDHQDHFDAYRRAYDNASTWLAESLDGQLLTSFEFSFDGHELYGHDGGALGPIFENALQAAEQIVEAQPNLIFELRRRSIEQEEYFDMLRLAKGELPNTMVVVSDFPAELKDSQNDIGGWNVSRQQTMLRIISRQEDGRIRITTRSLDRSNRTALEAIYAEFGLQPLDTELLGQRIYSQFSAQEQAALPERLRAAYDGSLISQYGGRWHSGRQAEYPTINTFDFVNQQQDLLSLLADAELSKTAQIEHTRYAVAATLAKRFSLLINRDSIDYQAIGLATYSLRREMLQATEEARSVGLTYSGCGFSAESSSDRLLQSGYGNKTDQATTYDFYKKSYCVICQAPPKTNEKPKMCGPCGICRHCDAKLRLTTQSKAA